MTEKISTKYKVLETREHIYPSYTKIVLICEVNTSPNKRRIIELKSNTYKGLYDKMKFIIAGDLIIVNETVLKNVKMDNGLCARRLDDILTTFELEDV